MFKYMYVNKFKWGEKVEIHAVLNDSIIYLNRSYL